MVEHKSIFLVLCTNSNALGTFNQNIIIILSLKLFIAFKLYQIGQSYFSKPIYIEWY